MERIQKVIAQTGYASRRKAEELVRMGRVTVNDQIVTTMGFLVKDSDVIKIDNQLITKCETKIYLALNKPTGYVCTVHDEHDRKTVLDLLPTKYDQFRIYPVGRLDYNTKGVLLLTNDGEFMNLLVGPRSGIEKVYHARVEGIVQKAELKPFYQGIKTKTDTYLPAQAGIISIDKEHNSTLLSITIAQGKYHQIKNMCEAINHPVKKLTRIKFGCVDSSNLPLGSVRELTIHEVKTLAALAKQDKNFRKRNKK